MVKYFQYKYKFTNAIKGISLVCISLAILSACGKKDKIVIPEDILSQQKMTEVMTDVMVADAYGTNNGLNLNGRGPSFSQKEIYPKIFKDHGVDDSSFYQSYRYYESHPNILKILMDSVVVKLQGLQSNAVLTETNVPKDAEEMKIGHNPNNPFGSSLQKTLQERRDSIKNN